MFDPLASALQLQNLSFWALVDILILALCIYPLLRLVKGTRTVNVIAAIVALLVFFLITGPNLLNLHAVHILLGNLLPMVPFMIIVLFQNQIKKALASLGRNPLSSLMPRRVEDNVIEGVTLAAATMASKRLGALIVIERGMGLRSFEETGIALDAIVSYDLLLNIFTRRSPMHDGAVIIGDGRIKAASCYLPLTMKANLSRAYGTRHRAAIGLSEETDALVIVTSEERGIISLADGGTIREGLTAQSLETALHRALDHGTDNKKGRYPERLPASRSTDA